jgi:hypothetical protein
VLESGNWSWQRENEKRYLWLSSMVIVHWYRYPKMVCFNLATSAGREKMNKSYLQLSSMVIVGLELATGPARKKMKTDISGSVAE